MKGENEFPLTDARSTCEQKGMTFRTFTVRVLNKQIDRHISLSIWTIVCWDAAYNVRLFFRTVGEEKTKQTDAFCDEEIDFLTECRNSLLGSTTFIQFGPFHTTFESFMKFFPIMNNSCPPETSDSATDFFAI